VTRVSALAAFMAAVVVYACFSAPTPDVLSWAEICVLGGLGVAAITGGFSKEILHQTWFKPLALLLVYGMVVGSVCGVLSGAAAADMARDMIGFMALAVPLVFYGLFQTPRRQKYLLIALLFIGLAFSCRYLWSLEIIMPVGGHDFLYLANSPLVPFAATWLLLQGCFIEPNKKRAGFFVILSLIPIMAMAGMMQRATLALLCVAWLGFLAHALIKQPRRAFIVLSVCAVLLALSWPVVMGVFDALVDKTNAVGLNTRDAELKALLATQSQSPLTAAFGAGWGSVFQSPAVGGQWVRFSHSFLSSLWWKTGWVGLILGIVAISSLVKYAYTRLKGQGVLFCALVLPLIPALFLYGSYKSLCFGLLLLGLIRSYWTFVPKGANQAQS
jgi:hypothetical protein